MIYKKIHFCFLLLVTINCLDLCKEYQSYENCIGSLVDKCIWDNIRNICYQTNDYLQGCSLLLNKKACLRQIGDVFGQLAKCRFTTLCEEIPDLKTENCENNLSKSGCLSVQNVDQVCIWKNDSCNGVNENQWNKIQNDFDNVLYSASACSHIEHYLVMHHTVLWNILSYTPDLLTEAENVYKQELGIEIDDTTEYDDPTQVFMQNNFLQSDGTFSWYTIRESKSITLSNLKMTNRYREGCIALEIESDSDFTTIFSLTDEVRGVNHIYCKYLNKNPSINDEYVFSNGSCQIFAQEDLNNQDKITQFNINCQSIDQTQCIFFDSAKYECAIQSKNYEYPCVSSSSQYQQQDIYKTSKQCKALDGNYYIDSTLNTCINTCLIIFTQSDCELQTDCKYLGTATLIDQLICSPTNGCDQIGISKITCKFLKAQCAWNDELNRCYSMTNEQISYLKCVDAFNLYVCTLITLTDQMCYWNQEAAQCINVDDQPLLITHSVFMDIENRTDASLLHYCICNMNLCKRNSQASTEYNKDKGYCLFDSSSFQADLTIMNKYRCINDISGYCKWNLYTQICECLSESQVKLVQCKELLDVNEKLCQKALVSLDSLICVYDSITSSCIEVTSDEVAQFGCSGHGLSEDQCVKKNMDGQLCQYSAGLCGDITTYLINSIRCTSLQKVNAQVCKMQSIYQSMCIYDETTHSCYSPSIYNTILFDVKINRYACQSVQNSNTYFDEIFNICVQFDDNSTLFNILSCEYHYVNKQTCVKILTDGQHCFWDDTLNRCRNYSEYFNNCDEYSTAPSRVCTALATNMDREFMKENYCTFKDGLCQISVELLPDCGSEQMNIHRCGACTGYEDENSDTPTMMCVFFKDQCIPLTDNSMDSFIILNNIQCQQANLKACSSVTTKNQFCQKIYNITSQNIILDVKCKPIANQSLTCAALPTGEINQNLCASATDACYYNASSNPKCQSPTAQNLICGTPGLSPLACINNTQNYACAIIQSQCVYIEDYYVQDVPCSNLNQFACEYYAFKRCQWNTSSCIQSNGSSIINFFSCSTDTTSTFLYFNMDTNDCMQEDAVDNYQNYTCDQLGLNRFGCLSIPNQYCQFFANKCQFYRDILCEDSNYDCGQNDTINKSCAKKDGKCYEISHKLFECDYFDETNYQFCLQYPKCIYVDKNCQQRLQIQAQDNCSKFDTISCLNNNKQFKCELQNGICIDDQLTACPSLNGYYSELSCTQFQKCLHGYTKSGIGFCFSGQSFAELKCEDLPLDLCLENLSHLNGQLKCYLINGNCKVIDNQTNCDDLSQYQSSYPACISLNDSSCIYSHLDHKCKQSEELSGKTNYTAKVNCISKDGDYIYQNNECSSLLQTNYLHSCENITKKACLSDLTKEIHCRWINQKCQNVLEFENKKIFSCNDLNQRTCQHIRLSNIQCYWNSTTKQCLTLNNNSLDCTLQVTADQGLNSRSLCSGQTSGNCVKNYDKMRCTIISQQLNDCNLYGMNKSACISLTIVPCQWIISNSSNGGYCESPNLFNLQCTDILNMYACQNVKRLDQFCSWNTTTQVCEAKTLSDCDSASQLNGDVPCKSIVIEACRFNYLTNQCSKPQIIQNCQNNFNFYACQNSSSFCSWNQNQCIDAIQFECNKMLNRFSCLQNSNVSCQWNGSSCTEFLPLEQLFYCKDLPRDISNKACKENAIDPCIYDQIYDKCFPTQAQQDNLNQYKTIKQLLELQIPTYQSPLIISNCENLISQNDCIDSRKQDQACIWKNNKCQLFTNFDSENCDASVNIYGCLLITKQQQYCFWRDRCLNWNQSLNIFSNVNINVCIDFSVNSIYENYSCKSSSLNEINCLSAGISKITCLSITNKQCMWNQTNNTCQDFALSSQSKCSDFQLISPYVCQMQNKYSCGYDSSTNNCKDASLIILEPGISMQACFKNQSTSTYWDGQNCNQLMKTIVCDQDILVNPIACQNITNQPCYYDSKTNKCISVFNINSLQCDTIGLNLKGCTSVINEPCIFSNQQCQKFNNYQTPCMTLQQVNAKSCASLTDQLCFYNDIDFRCRSPLLSIDYCNVSGVNQSICMNNALCAWNSDDLSCKCKEEQQQAQCNITSAQDCKSNSQCYFNVNQCVKKQCYHLTVNECSQQTLDGKACYYSLNNGCQSASVCEDIVDPKLPCTNIYINSVPCVQAKNQCITATNYELFCAYSDCSNSNCYSENGTCRKKICHDYSQVECIQHDGCYLNKDKQCQQLTTCSQIDQDTYGNDVQNICNQLSVNGFKCNWQQFALLDDTEVCTNQPCELYGPSNALCQGNEMNGYTCVLTSELICKQCEQITEKCFCNSQQYVCTYQDGKCQSIQCSSFITKDQCSQATGRCYWSSQVQDGTSVGQGCVKECIKIIDADDCNSRVDECYYESLVAQCKKGKKQIPDLSTTITIEPFYGHIIVSSIVLWLIIY